MSLYAEIKSIQHIPSTSTSSLNERHSYIICYQQISKPHQIYQTPNIQNWKDATIYYELKQSTYLTNAQIIYGKLKCNSDKNTSKVFAKKEKEFSTPYNQLETGEPENSINYYPLPLYSETSELSITIYEISNEESTNMINILDPKQLIKKIENKTYNQQPKQKISILRKQLKINLGLDIQNSITSSHSTSVSQNYEIIPKLQSNKDIFQCTVRTKLPTSNHIEISFIFSYDNLRQCTGYLRAGYANSFTNNIRKENHQVFNNAMQSNVSSSKINTNLRHIFNYSRNQMPVQRVQPAKVKREIQTPVIPKKQFSFFNFFCCNQQQLQKQSQVSVFGSQRQPDIPIVANVEKGERTPTNNKAQKIEATPKTSDNSGTKQLYGKVNLIQTDFYKGSCKTKNLFSIFDEKKNGQTTKFIQPYLGHNPTKI